MRKIMLVKLLALFTHSANVFEHFFYFMYFAKHWGYKKWDMLISPKEFLKFRSQSKLFPESTKGNNQDFAGHKSLYYNYLVPSVQH